MSNFQTNKIFTTDKNITFFSVELIKHKQVIALDSNQYTPTSEDMNAFRIRCADPTHADWKAISVDNVEKTSDCELFSDVNASAS